MKLSVVLALLPLALASPVSRRAGGPAPLHTAQKDAIASRYIVKFKDDTVTAFLTEANSLFKGEAHHTWDYDSYKGFAATLDAADLDTVRNLPYVDYIEEDAIIKLDQVTVEALTTQSGAPWGLYSVSHRSGNSGSTYIYDSTAGTDTCSYVIDTGILTTHNQFGGRAAFLANYADSSNTDGNGHGTHVAGTIGGSTYGVAKQTRLYAVKVLDSSGSGTTSGVISGINFVAADARTRSCPNGALANMSLGGGNSAALNSAVRALVASGVFLAAAAGNEAADASTSSPANEPTAFTVAAITSAGARATYSNYGSLVDINAPGSSVLSAYIGSNSATASLSGTSMATPHVVGVAAYFQALRGKATPAALGTYIRSVAVATVSGVPSGTTNLKLYNANGS